MFHKSLLVLSVIIAAAFAAPSFAADANFQANCDHVDPDSFYCEFDAERTPMGQAPTSCAPAVPERYYWRFGDGTSDVTTVPITDHVYVLGTPSLLQPGIYEACVSVGCSDDTTAYRCHCVDLNGQGNLPDCVVAGGWSPR